MANAVASSESKATPSRNGSRPAPAAYATSKRSYHGATSLPASGTRAAGLPAAKGKTCQRPLPSTSSSRARCGRLSTPSARYRGHPAAKKKSSPTCAPWAAGHGFAVAADAAGNLLVAVPASPGCETAPVGGAAVPPRHGHRKEPRGGARFRPRPDRGRARRRLGARPRHHPRRRQRHRRRARHGGRHRARLSAIRGSSCCSPSTKKPGSTAPSSSTRRWSAAACCSTSTAKTKASSTSAAPAPSRSRPTFPRPAGGAAAAAEGETFELMVSGLRGGHSGTEIHTHRGNANKILARLPGRRPRARRRLRPGGLRRRRQAQRHPPRKPSPSWSSRPAAQADPRADPGRGAAAAPRGAGGLRPGPRGRAAAAAGSRAPRLGAAAGGGARPPAAGDRRGAGRRAGDVAGDGGPGRDLGQHRGGARRGERHR